MNETLNTILTRRSTRKFSEKPIPEDEMELIVQAALPDMAVYGCEKQGENPDAGSGH